jgi:hypothetical protein
LAAIPAMRYLARHKIDIAEKIGSRALRADAMEAVTCGSLSLVVVASLAAQWFMNAWWIDDVGSLASVYFSHRSGICSFATRQKVTKSTAACTNLTDRDGVASLVYVFICIGLSQA